MATTYNIVERRYNGTDYDTLYPATKGENLVSPVPVELGGTGGITGAAGMKNLLDALSTVTPTGTDLLPLKDVSGNIAGKATIDSILSLVSGGAKIQTGSYVGTGTYGQANPCSLTFDFVPKLIIVTRPDAGLTTGSASRTTGGYWLLWIKGMNQATSGRSGYSNVLVSDYYSLNDNTFSWYSEISSTSSDGSADSQLNDTGKTYQYIAIG